jgi:exosortase
VQILSVTNVQVAKGPKGVHHAVFAIILLLSVGLFWRTLSNLVVYTWGHESYSHILLIPILSLYLIYLEKRKIFAEIHYSLGLGIGAMVCGICLYIVSVLKSFPPGGSGDLSLSVFSLVLVWIGAFVCCYGIWAARIALFPLLFLFLMIPIPDQLLDPTIHLLQLGSTEIAFLIFKAVGVPVLRQGFILSLPGVTIEVAKECSGIRSSVALFITCLLAGHLYLRTGWKVFLFALISVPMAIIKNGIRIATLTLLSIKVDPSFLRGDLHRDGGFVFFLLALVLLLPVLILLRKSEHSVSSPNTWSNTPLQNAPEKLGGST